jgi:hypothetical protein
LKRRVTITPPHVTFLSDKEKELGAAAELFLLGPRIRGKWENPTIPAL